MLSFQKPLVTGAVIGASSLVPGVSIGTIAVVISIYDELIASVSNLKKDFKKSISFLIPFAVGAGAAMLLFSHVITLLINNFYMASHFFFIGVIIGSIPLIYKKAAEHPIKGYHWIAFAVGLSFMLATMLFQGEGNDVAVSSFSWGLAVKLMFTNMIAAIAMIIPGVSGSLMMILMGVYNTIMGALKDFNILLMIPIGIGVLLGFLIGAKIIDFVLRRFVQAAYLAILGLIVGSVPVLFNTIRVEDKLVTGFPLVIAIIILAAGIGMTIILSSDKFRKHFEKKKD